MDAELHWSEAMISSEKIIAVSHGFPLPVAGFQSCWPALWCCFFQELEDVESANQTKQITRYCVFVVLASLDGLLDQLELAARLPKPTSCRNFKLSTPGLNLFVTCSSSWKGPSSDLFLWHICLRTERLFGLVWLMSLLFRYSKACTSSALVPWPSNLCFQGMFYEIFMHLLSPESCCFLPLFASKSGFHISGTMDFSLDRDKTHMSFLGVSNEVSILQHGCWFEIVLHPLGPLDWSFAKKQLLETDASPVSLFGHPSKEH